MGLRWARRSRICRVSLSRLRIPSSSVVVLRTRMTLNLQPQLNGLTLTEAKDSKSMAAFHDSVVTSPTLQKNLSVSTFINAMAIQSLRYPIFRGHESGLAPVEEFDSLNLRSGSHDMAQRGAYMSNRFVDDSMLEMGSMRSAWTFRSCLPQWCLLGPVSPPRAVERCHVCQLLWRV